MWLLRDMEFLFECSTRYLTSKRSERVRYRIEHAKRNSIGPRTDVLFTIYLVPKTVSVSFIISL